MPELPGLPEVPGCPCGAGHDLAECCGRYLDGADAPTAEALMRSRYTAFVRSDVEHLLRTWHPTTRPAADDLAASLADGPRWSGLTVLASQAGGVDDARGVVEFEAHHHDGTRAGVLHERSRFVRQDGRWFYVRGRARWT